MVTMYTYELTVRVPVSSSSKQTRPVQVRIQASSPGDAIAIARGQYGSDNVIPLANKVSG